MNHDVQTRESLGPFALDVDARVDKRDRGRFLIGGIFSRGEKTPGVGDTTGVKNVEPANALFCPHTKDAPRGAWGSFSFSLVMRLEAAGLLPLETPTKVDEDFLPWKIGEDVEELPTDGEHYLVVETTGHGTRKPVAIPLSAGKLKVTNLYNPDVPPPRSGTRIADVQTDETADLSSLLRVTQILRDSSQSLVAGAETHTAALNFGAGGSLPIFPDVTPAERERLLGQIDTTAAPVFASGSRPRLGGSLSASFGGPLVLHDLAGTPFHFGRTSEPLPGGGRSDVSWNRLAIDTNAIYADVGNPALFSGPLAFISPSRRADWTLHNPADPEVLLRYDEQETTWKWSLPGLAIQPPLPPRANQQVQNVNIVNINNNPLNINVNNNWWFGPFIFPPPNPGPGDPIDPERSGHEKAQPSLHGTGQRQGRFGGPPVSPSPDPTDPAQTGGFGGLPTGEGGKEGGGGAGGGGGGAATAPVTLPEPDSVEKRFREVQKLNREAKIQGAPWVKAPLVWSLQTIAAVDNADRALNPTLPAGEFYRSDTAPGLCFFSPSEIIFDAPDNPPAVSTVDFLMYRADRGGEPSQMAWGVPDVDAATWDDGFSFGIDDDDTPAAGLIDAMIEFRNAANAVQDRRLKLKGRLRIPWVNRTGTVIAADQDDYNLNGPTSNEVSGGYLLAASGPVRTITGIANGKDGDEIVLLNAGAAPAVSTIRLANLSGSSSAGNRIDTGPAGGFLNILLDGRVTLRYEATLADSGNGAWLVISTR